VSLLNLTNKYAWFHLSDIGRQVLRGLVPNGVPFEALVMREDEVGTWIMAGASAPPAGTPSVPITLIKWDYIACITYEHPIAGADSGVDEILLV
jgi:hypothetical protein